MDAETLEELYNRLLGGNVPAPEQPTPEAVEIQVPVEHVLDMRSAGEGDKQPGPSPFKLRLQDLEAELESTYVRLGEEDYRAIEKIVATRIAEKAQAQLDEFRSKYGLHKNRKKMALQEDGGPAI